MVWWNSSYVFSKEITITSNSGVSPVGSLVQITIDLDGFETDGKIRSDREDLEVIYETDDATPSHVVLGRDITGSTLSFVTNVEVPNTGKFYIYYGNSTLANQPSRPSYTLDLYPIIVTQDGEGVSYTRPTEHWVDGVSSVRNAVASFSFAGPRVKINAEKGNDKGIGLVRIDGGSEEEMDLFAITTSQGSAYTKTGLTEAEHEIAIKVSGESRPGSSGVEIKLISFAHADSVTTVLGVEAIVLEDWTTYLGGSAT